MGDNLNYRDRKYRDDRVFQLINSNYLTLAETDKRVNNEHLKLVIEEKFIPLMKEDALFKLLYKRIMYGGSFYKGTKCRRPDEFDLDFIIKIPINYSKIRLDANHSNYGYVKIKIDTSGVMDPKWQEHSKALSKWLTQNDHLDQDKFRAWMERIFTSAFSKLHRNNEGYVLSHNGKTYIITHKKSGPAFTVKIKTPGGHPIDVDLVPCLEFEDVTLGYGYRTIEPYNNGRSELKNKIMVVAKPLNGNPDSNILWRLCFYEQEKRLLEGDVKPVIRMMKKFRDTMNWESMIASYYIETLFYHELYRLKNDPAEMQLAFLRAPKTWLFVHALNKLREALENQYLPYFWHEKHNLIGKLNSAGVIGIANRLKRIIKDIEKNIETDRFVLADVVLGPQEATRLREISDNSQMPVEEPFVVVDKAAEQPPKSNSNCSIL